MEILSLLYSIARNIFMYSSTLLSCLKIVVLHRFLIFLFICASKLFSCLKRAVFLESASAFSFRLALRASEQRKLALSLIVRNGINATGSHMMSNTRNKYSCCTIQHNTMQYNVIQQSTIQYNATHTLPYNARTMQDNATKSNIIQYMTQYNTNSGFLLNHNVAYH